LQCWIATFPSRSSGGIDQDGSKARAKRQVLSSQALAWRKYREKQRELERE